MFKKIVFVIFITWFSVAFAVSGKINMTVNGLHDGRVNVIEDYGVLFSGDSFQLRVKPGDNSYLYAFLVDTLNDITLLNSSNFIINNNIVSLPKNNHWYRLDSNIGTETLVIVGAKSEQIQENILRIVKSKDWNLLSNKGMDVTVLHIRHLDKSSVTRGAEILSHKVNSKAVDMKKIPERIIKDAKKYINNSRVDGKIVKRLIDASSNNPLTNSLTTRGVKEIHVFKKASPAVVLVFRKDKGDEGGIGIGTGSLLTKEGTIITNWHVVQDSKMVGVAFMPEKKRKLSKDDLLIAKVLKVNEESDLALIKLEKKIKNVKPLKFGSIDDLEIGQDVHAIGHPVGGADWSYTKGYVSQFRPSHRWKTNDKKHVADMVIQTQTPINPGNSGGPLLNDDGEIVGVNTFKSTKSVGVNFAVSVDDVRSFLKQKGNKQAEATKSKIEKISKEKLSEKLNLNVLSVDEVDFYKDGSKDILVKIDENKNNKPEMLIVYLEDKEKGMIIIFDDDEDGHWDEMALDTDNNGKADFHIYDSDADGKRDMIGYDDDEDGKVDRYEEA